MMSCNSLCEVQYSNVNFVEKSTKLSSDSFCRWEFFIFLPRFVIYAKIFNISTAILCNIFL